MEYEVVLTDATETPIERKKKTKALLLWQKEKDCNLHKFHQSQAT